MSPERWRQLTELFETALRRDTAERASFLAEVCADDEELRQEVEAMLRSHKHNSFIEEPALDVERAPQSLFGRGVIAFEQVEPPR
jgi:hypothetical protein